MARRSSPGRALLVLGAALSVGASAAGQSLIHRTTGTTNQRHGTATVIVGDLDGDGRAEFAVGASGLGAAVGWVRMYSGASGSLRWELAGPAAASSFGSSLAALGDVDGDGAGDLAIGAPLASVPGLGGCGIVRVVSGLTGVTLFEAHGDSAGDHMGWSVGCAGDVDHDGVPDVIGGAVDDDDLGVSTGSARVWSGASGAVIRTIVGSQLRELLGYSVDGGADVDGDGTADLVIGGAYLTAAPQGGVVRVYSGASGIQLWSTPFAPARDGLGSAVAFVGDVDGDGRSDVLAGARQPFTGGIGYARLYSGANGSLLQELAPEAPIRSFGTAVAGAGDVDYDGVPDYAVGAPDSSTNGALSGVVHLYSGATATLLHEFVGASGSRLGNSVRGGGDISGEHAPDLVMGAPNEFAVGAQSGAAYARRGSDVPPPDGDGDGTPDSDDGCPTDPNKTSPGSCGCGTLDTDSDDDGTPDCNDGCPTDASKLEPGACGCGVADADSDSDGALDCNDGCPNDAGKVAPGACGCGTSDADTDGDGTPDCNDGCPSDPNKIAPGACGCGVGDADSDGDGTRDCQDGCPNDPGKVAPGICGCGSNETDSDGDGIPNCVDGCPNDASRIAPGPCGCGAALTDRDHDGTPDCQDACADDPFKVLPGACGCGRADVDIDGNGVFDCNETFQAALEADVSVISFSAHGVQRLKLRAGKANAGKRFVMMASLSGTEPGFDIDKVHVPLVLDYYTQISLIPCYSSESVPVIGRFDAKGEARVEIQSKMLNGKAFWVGKTIHHAYVVLDEKFKVKFASNAVSVTIRR